MICKHATELDGRTIFGETFVPADSDSSHAVFHRNGRCCGITYEMGRFHPYLRCAPGLTLPPGARDIEVWRRLAWNVDDERFLEFRIDESDGELYYLHNEKAVADDPEHCMGEVLDLLLGDELEDLVLEFVRECYGN